jgi:hypothetical protein
VEGCCEHDSEFPSSIKDGEFSLDERLPASKGGLCSMESA